MLRQRLVRGCVVGPLTGRFPAPIQIAAKADQHDEGVYLVLIGFAVGGRPGLGRTVGSNPTKRGKEQDYAQADTVSWHTFSSAINLPLRWSQYRATASRRHFPTAQ